MTSFTNVTLGIFELTVTGPPALLDALACELVCEVRGSDRDQMDRNNLEYGACEQVARALGYGTYDDIPESVWDTFLPVEFSEPRLGANKHRNPDGTQQWFVGVYDVTRCEGGPEEGGWWYDVGTLVQQTAVATHDEAQALRERLREQFPRTDKRYSVLGGDDFDIVVGIEPHAEEFPQEVPRYE